ncbi:alpha-ketoacid dehydrogenase subunit beta [Reinekea sp.]|jgi:pyruvate/2-oxoglutarate/acetoin dehydrogenase E1 component|uniref:alpha-ketoacid dehydrogenase subunit beta n=1 Tax=Reinekea sp. TaxID=1970455 RepID=UPI002A8022CE|nr:transketolase C-terminal domain-containing protein [Reinekea sp.]
MTTQSYWAAIKAGIEQAMLGDERVLLMGQADTDYGDAYTHLTSGELLPQFGTERVRMCPLSAADLVSAAIGAALGGLKPLVELSSATGLSVLDPLVNSAASLGYKSGGQVSVPLVIRMVSGPDQPFPSLANWIAQIPGLKVLVPSTVCDARYMLSEALADPDPTVIFEPCRLYSKEEPCHPRPTGYNAVQALVRRAGTDLTLIAYGAYLDEALAVAEQLLVSAGRSIEVIDLRCLRPLDCTTLFASVRKTHRVVLVDECWKTGSFAAEIGMLLVEHCWSDLYAPIRRVCSFELPALGPEHLSQTARPSRHDIETAVWSVLGEGGQGRRRLGAGGDGDKGDFDPSDVDIPT